METDRDYGKDYKKDYKGLLLEAIKLNHEYADACGVLAGIGRIFDVTGWGDLVRRVREAVEYQKAIDELRELCEHGESYSLGYHPKMWYFVQYAPYGRDPQYYKGLTPLLAVREAKELKKCRKA